jgi:hypothetical protein
MTSALTFTLSLRLEWDGWEGMELECVGERAAIDAGREALQARIDMRPRLAGPTTSGAVGVGIGSMLAHPDRVVWLGEWEWTPEDGWFWQSSD